MGDMEECLKRLISLVRLQFGEDRIDEFSFILGYYSAQGSRKILVDILRAHAITNKELEVIARIVSKKFEGDLGELRKILCQYCEEEDIPVWLR